MIDDIILIDKPAGMTSFGVVARLRRVLSERGEGKGAARAADSFRARSDERGPHGAGFVGYGGGKPSVVPHKRKRVKVGHTGTLDPFATGLMIIVTGKECKNAEKYSKLDKTYEATIRLGQESTTGDPEGEISDISAKKPTRAEVEEAMGQLTGVIEQQPPIYSAIKIDGQRAYKLARKGEAIEMPTRQVHVYSIEVIHYRYPEVKIRAHVSSGTYIRTLAQDAGKILDTGAYCMQLRRTAVDKWNVSRAQKLSDFGINN